MAVIAYLTHDEDADSYKGVLQTLAIREVIEIIPNGNKLSDKQPDYRIFAANGFELGAAWKKTSERSGKPYVSCGMSAPEWGRKLYANVAPSTASDDATHVLIWNAPEE